ncbi:hypothetical protein AN652_18045 [Xanthomonas arboricola pv. pruni]|nr:hypothetical protein DK27_16295 [Xanthomonas arboricola pv. pruni]KPN08087.1 hypothetical protein AN652_18045 [Xanthomonas arboricola pv. pruni]OEH51305.1 hypothetical protein XapnCFBP3894_08135 [Xanthomonas arboricola pv. pruni]
MYLHRSYHFQQPFAVNQFNRLALGKAFCVLGVDANAGDLDRMGLVMREQAEHFPYYADADLLVLPLLALHQRAAAVLAQDQVDAAVGSAQTCFFDAVALAAKRIAHQ